MLVVYSGVVRPDPANQVALRSVTGMGAQFARNFIAEKGSKAAFHITRGRA